MWTLEPGGTHTWPWVGSTQEDTWRDVEDKCLDLKRRVYVANFSPYMRVFTVLFNGL